ncbi:TnsA-like heteromeric transposase endonuclease subunit [Streptomyces sp. NBC_00286]|uniref:TnsA-like heteromeric transposase endonuclease subunit n=1 Tax=Streptomyces sp. NBC_00286 TaxID=2975701 RepID=UPI002E2A2E71|nr:TnsA-like heteromeric transposase endonuclease subunit [Streptomyces sp. NBC_00286]
MADPVAAAVPLSGADPFEVEYVDGVGRVVRSALTQCWHIRFEGCRPSRAFPVYRGQKNFTGWWWTATTDTHVGYESWLERAVLIGLDFDPDVVGISSQPFWLHWFDGPRPRRHAPDYFVRRADGSADVVDVRADDRIEARDAEAFAATAEACARAGWGFRRIGQPPAAREANLRWLAGYRHPRCMRPEVAGRLWDAFASPRPLSRERRQPVPGWRSCRCCFTCSGGSCWSRIWNRLCSVPIRSCGCRKVVRGEHVTAGGAADR